MPKHKGVFIISLDLELYWGARDKLSLDDYIKKYPKAILIVSTLLNLFNEYKIHATWATVGLLFFETRDELIGGLPSKKPDYANKRLSPYEFINKMTESEGHSPYCCAFPLIKAISAVPGQEVASHTFSHYYCLERGQNIDAFESDLEAAIKIAGKYGFLLESLVFPRNQFNPMYLEICSKKGIRAYRGNESSWIYNARSEEKQSLFARGLRLLDAYVNIFGHNCYSPDKVERKLPLNLPASRLLFRPINAKLNLLEPLRLRRILVDLTYAARKGLIYHLWWHPHNLELSLETNLAFIEKILKHYLTLRESYGMENLTMGELSHQLLERKTNGE